MYGRAFDSTNPWHSSLRSWALIPYIDLVNHAGHPNGGYQDSKSNSNPSGDGPFTAEATDCQRYGTVFGVFDPVSPAFLDCITTARMHVR